MPSQGLKKKSTPNAKGAEVSESARFVSGANRLSGTVGAIFPRFHAALLVLLWSLAAICSSHLWAPNLSVRRQDGNPGKGIYKPVLAKDLCSCIPPPPYSSRFSSGVTPCIFILLLSWSRLPDTTRLIFVCILICYC